MMREKELEALRRLGIRWIKQRSTARPRAGAREGGLLPLPFDLPSPVVNSLNVPAGEVFFPVPPAPVNVLLAPPYSVGSDPQSETGSMGLVRYSAANPATGTIELMAQVIGTEAEAMPDGPYRTRIASAQLLAGVYTVPTVPGTAQLKVTVPVVTSGASLVYGGDGAFDALAMAQLTTRVDVVVAGNIYGKSATPHCNVSIAAGDPGQTFETDHVLAVSMPTHAGDFVAIFLSAELRVAAEDGEWILAAANVSGAEGILPGGFVSFPNVQLTLN